jgi:hypothetical protein
MVWWMDMANDACYINLFYIVVSRFNDITNIYLKVLDGKLSIV